MFIYLAIWFSLLQVTVSHVTEFGPSVLSISEKQGARTAGG